MRARARRPVFVCADVFLGFLVRDNERHYEAARRLFEAAEAGELKLETTDLAIAEVLAALGQRHGFGAEELGEVAEAILGTRNLRVTGRAVLGRAVEMFRGGGMGFPEACMAARALQGGSAMATFEKSRYRKAAGLEFYV